MDAVYGEVSSVIHSWIYTGEFIRACTSLKDVSVWRKTVTTYENTDIMNQRLSDRWYHKMSKELLTGAASLKKIEI